MHFMGVSLHVIHLDFDLVKRHVAVGVRQQFQMEGVSFLLGNDFTGGKVLPNSEIIAVPLSEHPDELEQKYPGVFKVCTVSCVMSKEAKAGFAW